MKTFIPKVGITISFAILVSTLFAAPKPKVVYQLKSKIVLGGEGSWDYLALDSAARRLYIARATRVMVINVDSGKMVGEIPDTPGVHGTAFAPEFNKGFNSDGREAMANVFDLKTLKPITKVKTGDNPDAIAYEPTTHRVFTFNGHSSDSTAIDAGSEKVAGTIPLGGKPEFAVADGKGHLYVNLEDKSELLQLDPQKLTVVNRWPLAPCESPSGLAMDAKTRRLFVGCDNKMMAVVNADNGKIVTTLPIGEGVDATAFDPGTKLAFSSNGDGTLTVVREDSPEKFEVIQNVETQRGARTMALDLKTHDAYLVTAEFGPRPAPTAQQPHPRPPMVPGTFVLLVYKKVK